MEARALLPYLRHGIVGGADELCRFSRRGELSLVMAVQLRELADARGQVSVAHVLHQRIELFHEERVQSRPTRSVP